MCKHDKTYLQIAFLIAGNSYAQKRKVGALIVKDRRIISDGYNGTPEGFPNVCEFKTVEFNIEKLNTLPEVFHAEANAILKLARSFDSAEGSTLYLTIPPCIECAKLIIQARISRVVYASPHKKDGLDLLKKAKIKTELVKT